MYINKEMKNNKLNRKQHCIIFLIFDNQKKKTSIVLFLIIII